MLTKLFYKIWDFWLRQPEKLRFLLVGGFNTIIAYLLFILAILFLSEERYQESLILSWIISSFISFTLMKIFVFCTKGGWKSEYAKCVASWGVSYCVNAIVLEIFVGYLNWNVYFGQLIAIMCYMCVTYILFKHFAFRPQKNTFR